MNAPMVESAHIYMGRFNLKQKGGFDLAALYIILEYD